MKMNAPKLTVFNFEGGLTVSPEFMALLLGLVLYTSAFVAEVVRAGIQSVGKGQREAAMSIGLRPTQVLNLVILPQALRVIVPPLTSQMLNLTKNSSLAVAIGIRILFQWPTQPSTRQASPSKASPSSWRFIWFSASPRPPS